MKISKTLKALALTSALGFASTAFAADIAIVNLTQVFQSVPDGQPAFAKLQKKYAPQANQLQAQQDALNKQIQAFQANKVNLTAVQQANQTQTLVAQQQKLQDSITAYQNDLKAQQQKLLTVFGNDMKNSVMQIAKNGGYHLVLSSQTAIYNDNTVDITPQVIKSMQ